MATTWQTGSTATANASMLSALGMAEILFHETATQALESWMRLLLIITQPLADPGDVTLSHPY
jgi:hypothetical protein